MRKFLEIVSFVFNYWTWSLVGVVVALFRTGLTAGQIRLLLPISIMLDVISPILILYGLAKIGKIKDVSLYRRKDRPIVFGLSALIFAVSTLFSFFLGNNLFFVLHLIMLLMGLTIFLVSLFYKISGHMILNVGFIFIFNFLFNWNSLWLFLIVPLVAFARVYLNKHTVWQVVTGTIVGLVEPYLILRIFGL